MLIASKGAELQIEHRRYDYLDGLRGLAALQVLLGHCALAFFPSYLGPLGFIADGDFAVLLFFTMSGFVLTYSFERTPYAVVENALARLMRLGLPLAAASAIAYLALSLLPHWYSQAADLSHSAWLGHKHIDGLLRSAADISALSLLTGCSDTTLFGFLSSYLPPIRSSPDGPTWSLHIEFWGSMLVQLAVLNHTRSVTRYWATAAACIVLIGGNALIVFLIGHAAALLVRSSGFETLQKHKYWVLALATFALSLGILVAGHGDLPGMYRLEQLSMLTSVVRPYGWFHWNKEVAAVLVFGAVLVLSPLQTTLRTRPMLWLGKESFAIYLLHLPILMTLGALSYVGAWRFGFAIASLAATLVVCCTTLALAPAFEFIVDRPAIKLSRLVRREPAGSPVAIVP